jgi:hypothetical protein
LTRSEIRLTGNVPVAANVTAITMGLALRVARSARSFDIERLADCRSGTERPSDCSGATPVCDLREIASCLSEISQLLFA